jgi:hypothetical protein
MGGSRGEPSLARPVVIDSTILVYAVSATVQRAPGENAALSWLAVGFFTAVSVVSNTSHVLAPAGAVQPLSLPWCWGLS